MKNPGKLSLIENTCPWCEAHNEYSDESMEVMELSAQHYKICTQCQFRFVDTYLIDFVDDYFSEDNWCEGREYQEEEVDQAELFQRLTSEGFLAYDYGNPNPVDDYYDNPNNTERYMEKLCEEPTQPKQNSTNKTPKLRGLTSLVLIPSGDVPTSVSLAGLGRTPVDQLRSSKYLSR